VSQGAQLGSIFISYRRHDSEGEAGRLFDDLVAQFGEHSVFMDVAGIEVGRDFRKAIDESVANCGVLLAMIGPAWLDEKNEKGERRLDDPGDFVRVETASALRRGIPVVPVLLRGAKVPRSEQLPDDLKELSYRNCVELTHVRWKSDVQVLVGGLRSLLNSIDSKTSAKLSANKPGESSVSQESIAQSAPPNDAGSQTLNPQVLAHLTKELARYIGPVAEIMVKRAAKRCATLPDLCHTVAEEIDNSIDRARFLKSCGER
jgi:TIR domain